MTFKMSTVWSWSWVAMAATRGVVNLTDASKDLWEEDTGLMIPIPPRRTGRANKSLSILEQGGRPVRAGIKC